MTAVTHFALARPYRLEPRQRSRRSPACTPSWSAASSPSGCSSAARRAGRACGSTPPRCGEWPGSSGCGSASRLNYAAIGLVVDLLDRIAELEAAHAAHRPRPPGGASMDMNRLTQKSQEALHDAQTKALRFGHTEVDGEHLLLALLDQPDGLVAPAARAGRRRPGPAARASWRPSSAAGPRVSGPGAAPGQVLRHPAARRGCSTPPSARPSGSRTSTSRSSTCVLALVEEGSGTAAGRLLARAGADPRRASWRR